MNNRGQPTRIGPPPWWLGQDLKTPDHKKTDSYEMLYRASESDGFFETTKETENSCDIWKAEC